MGRKFYGAEKSWLTSRAFATLCGTTKETLRHIKDVGLLLPVHRGENNYFYYDVEQFYDFYAIFILSSEGVALADVFTIPNNLEGFKTLLDKLQACSTSDTYPNFWDALALIDTAMQKAAKSTDGVRGNSLAYTVLLAVTFYRIHHGLFFIICRGAAMSYTPAIFATSFCYVLDELCPGSRMSISVKLAVERLRMTFYPFS